MTTTVLIYNTEQPGQTNPVFPRAFYQWMVSSGLLRGKRWCFPIFFSTAGLSETPTSTDSCLRRTEWGHCCFLTFIGIDLCENSLKLIPWGRESCVNFAVDLPAKAMLGRVMPYLLCRNSVSLHCCFSRTVRYQCIYHP